MPSAGANPTLCDCIAMCLWVAAHHGLRRQSIEFQHGTPALREQHSASWMRDRRYDLACRWRMVHDITTALGNPPAPGGPR